MRTRNGKQDEQHDEQRMAEAADAPESAAPGSRPRAAPGTPFGTFPETVWSLVLRAGLGERAALSAFCAMYWHPVYSFLRGQGCGPEEARDTTQGFFAALLRGTDLAKLDQAKGHFRSWLRTSAKHFWLNEIARRRALRHGGASSHFSIDLAAAEEHLADGLVDRLTPEQLFDRTWGRALIERAATALRAHYAAEGKEVSFDEIFPTLSRCDRELSDRELASRLGLSEEEVRSERFRMKARFHRSLRLEVLQTGDPFESVDDVLRSLIDDLSEP